MSCKHPPLRHLYSLPGIPGELLGGSSRKYSESAGVRSYAPPCAPWQVPLFNILAKFDGETITEVVRPQPARIRYTITRLPRYLILHMKRFKKNNFFVEKNPTLGEYGCLTTVLYTLVYLSVRCQTVHRGTHIEVHLSACKLYGYGTARETLVEHRFVLFAHFFVSHLPRKARRAKNQPSSPSPLSKCPTCRVHCSPRVRSALDPRP